MPYECACICMMDVCQMQTSQKIWKLCVISVCAIVVCFQCLCYRRSLELPPDDAGLEDGRLLGCW